MSRIAHCFERLAEHRRKALITYIMAGDPRPQETVGLMHSLVGAGADIIELGVPFSDPMADGPVIQAAAERALAHGTRLIDVLSMVEAFRAENADTPVILMGYANPIEAMGCDAFVDGAARAGVDGVITVDLPPEESAPMLRGLRAAGLDPIFLTSPTTTAERLALIAEVASGFVYCVSLKGVTGSAALDPKRVSERLQEIRSTIRLPLGVGFGISTPESAAAVAAVADAVVVGSALVQRVGDNQQDPERIRCALSELVHGMRQAIDLASAA